MPEEKAEQDRGRECALREGGRGREGRRGRGENGEQSYGEERAKDKEELSDEGWPVATALSSTLSPGY